MHINSTVLLIGSGRLAQHLKFWNSLLEKPNQLLFWNRSEDVLLLNEHLTKCSHVWLAVSDSAIVPFYDSYLHAAKKSVVHFSGALHDDRLFCAHPLMSFPLNLLPAETYAKIFFVISGFNNLRFMLPGFNNQFTVLNAENKSYYHALCVIAGNFPQLIWNEVALKMQALNLPSESLDLYIRQITENYLEFKSSAITGPIVRRDFITIEKNLNSLNSTPNLRNIYSAITKEFIK